MDTPRIPRQVPLPPNLTEAALQHIEDTVFFEAPPVPSDVLFVFGYIGGDWAAVAALYHSGIAHSVLATGKYGADSEEQNRPQAHVIRDALIAHGVDSKHILIEDQSTNTSENVEFGRRVLAEHGIHPTRIVFACKSHHSGRCLRTLAKFFPEATFSCVHWDQAYDGVPVSRSTWRDHAISQERVYAEFLRIQEYTKMGWIAK